MTTVPTPAPRRMGHSRSRAPAGISSYLVTRISIFLCTYGPPPRVLTHRQLHEQQRHPDHHHHYHHHQDDPHCLPAESQHDEVRHQEGPAARFVSVVRKPPDVAQAHRVAEIISISRYC